MAITSVGKGEIIAAKRGQKEGRRSCFRSPEVEDKQTSHTIDTNADRQASSSNSVVVILAVVVVAAAAAAVVVRYRLTAVSLQDIERPFVDAF